MINYTFGPPPATFELMIDSVQDEDPAFAQSLYDVQTSGRYGQVLLSGAPVGSDLYEIVSAQHVFWDDELEQVRGNGISWTRDDPYGDRIIGSTYVANARSAEWTLPPEETAGRISRTLAALRSGQLATFAAWEFVRTPRHMEGSLRVIYPRLVFTDALNPVLAIASSVSQMEQDDLDASLNTALLASAVAYHNSLD